MWCGVSLGWRDSRGFVVVGASLVAVVAIASVALSKLPAESLQPYHRSLESERYLARAKAALIGYSATYAEQHQGLPSSGIAPGFLPCPDVDDDGSPDGACGSDASGRLPWRRLGLPPPARPVRYKVADPHRANPIKHVPVNTDVMGGTGRQGDAAATLEFEGEPRLSLRLGQKELGGILERRAMVEVGRVINAFRAAQWNHNRALPWLRSPSEPDPAGSMPGMHRGRLPIHTRGWFRTGFTFDWRDGPTHNQRWQVDDSEGRCWWKAAHWFLCEVRARFGRLMVRIRVDRAEIEPPASDRTRTRSGAFRGLLPEGASIRLQLVNRSMLSARTLERGPGQRVDVRVSNVRYALEPGREVPWWYVVHEWDERIHLVISPGFAGDVDWRCLVWNSCLRHPDLTPVRPVAAAIVGSGPALPGQRRYAGAADSAYFEAPRLGIETQLITPRSLGGKNDRIWPLRLKVFR